MHIRGHGVRPRARGPEMTRRVGADWVGRKSPASPLRDGDCETTMSTKTTTTTTTTTVGGLRRRATDDRPGGVGARARSRFDSGWCRDADR
jgi:hypothetical protein